MAKRLGDLIREWSPEQLTGLDAMFAYAETPRTPMHIGDCKIYDPSTAPGGKVRFKDILTHVEERVHRAKTFRQKLKQVPFGYDHPYWIDDPDFDIEFHVRHIALPQPGDWRQLCIQVARLHARSLDMSKPLWEFTVIEGLDNIPNVPKGAYAIVGKVHHCAIDGASGVDIAQALHSLTPDETVDEEVAPWTPGRHPSTLEMIARANLNNATKPFHAVRVAGRMAPGALKFASGITSGEIKLLGAKVPRTRFNGIVSAHRVVEGLTFDIEDIKVIRKRIPGATVNDAMLAIVGGGMRKYLKAKDELPADSLIAMAPVSVRTKDEKNTLGNQVTALSIPLGTHIADPLARLHYTHDVASNQKAMSNAVGARELSEASKLAPAMVSGISARLYSRLGLANRLSPMFNTVVTNVPGPQVPLYMAGAKLVTAYAIGPVMDSMGLFHAVTSYCGEITISFTACREMLPDPAFYRECLQESFDELRAAAAKPRVEKNREAATADAIATPAMKAAADDFTRIKGVGARLAERLRNAGLVTFEQLAALSQRQVDELDEELGLRGRAARDGWLAQAAALAAEQDAMAAAASDVRDAPTVH
ncbi:MAG: wax ester/triacylglycerol synthase family O-acyltransferase [Alphaproteobacteria bacterium]|nr:wax ester/triacylglycerol synthase family O-acyltransferase [Alphaproteobacteria bacterium]